MNSELEQKLWNVGQGEVRYSPEVWNEIIQALLDDFQEFINQDFQRDPEYSLHLEIPDSPSFTIWIWSETKQNPFISRVWLAVMGAEIVADRIKGKVFSVGLTLFLFDAITKKRLHLKTGESFIDFLFQKQTDGKGGWHCLGWLQDEYYEWEEIEYE